MSMKAAQFMPSWSHPHLLASELAKRILRSHKGSTVWTLWLPAYMKGGVMVSLPMNFGLAGSLTSTFTTSGVKPKVAILPSGLMLTGPWKPGA